MTLKQDPNWFKTAIFIELNLRAYQDSNADGWGDFNGLTRRLPYLKDLGVDAIWLLPISPSPMRDDGYDVSDYTAIYERYGTMQDFDAFIAAAHEFGIRVLVEIIPNHSSDQHPWFQASRDPQHPQHEEYKDFYVWSDTDQKYQDARIIFLDTETSNWAWDEKRQMYFWHRFYSTQPDLNYDNPAVQQAMLDVVKFWIDRGADGLRVDAPPYLFEREGTNCENLPETHAYLKRMRAFVDEYAPQTLLISESNQWPEETMPYFGAGDEMHMNFNFPLMPRLYMALAKGDRTPIEEIMARTPPLPEGCQWGTFLRCHDELTLEMVTPEERQWMWETYAPDPAQRINLGIRRRLAPLMDNDPRKILLMHSLLLTMGGSPFLYYGDEIGMGDDVTRFDRNGLRSPMQWDGGYNGGFSDAPEELLYARPIDDPVYGYKAVNVAAQEPDPESLLNRVRHLIAVRKRQDLFGLGSFEWADLGPDTRKVVAYFRKHEGKQVLCLNNLSDEPLSLDLPWPARDLLNGAEYAGSLELPPFGYVWLMQLGG